MVELASNLQEAITGCLSVEIEPPNTAPDVEVLEIAL